MTFGSTIRQRDFGCGPDGQVVHEYELDNGAGLTLRAIGLGSIVTALHAPDRNGRSANVVLGFDRLDDYVERNPHFGVIVGRCANRIAGARFTLDGTEHRLDRNDGPNTLHGGTLGFGRRGWTVTPEPVAADGSVVLRLQLDSADGDQGFPGRLAVTVRYTLTVDQCWRIDYEARCDRATVVNLSHHDYWNLAGGGSALGHRLTLHASRYTAVDATLIPTELRPVAGTPFDFRQPTPIEARLRAADEQLARGHGYDHNWVLDRDGPGLCPAARLEDEASGRVLELLTTEPALQFYSGNFLDGSLLGAGSALIRQGDGLCLETQHHPDAPNRPDFPSVVLRPGERYASSTLHRFSAS